MKKLLTNSKFIFHGSVLLLQILFFQPNIAIAQKNDFLILPEANDVSIVIKLDLKLGKLQSSQTSIDNQDKIDEINSVVSKELEKNIPDIPDKVVDVIPPIAQHTSLDKPESLEVKKIHQTQINKINPNPSQIIPKQAEENILNFSYKAEDLLPISGQNANLYQPLSSEVTKNEPNQPDSLYKTPPNIVPQEKVPTILTTFALNDLTINHLTKQVIDGQFVFGNERSENYYVNGLYQLDSKVIQSLSQKNVFTSDFKADYVQLRTVNHERKVSISYSEPQTIRGFETQQTFIGPCELINSNPSKANQQCTLLPPLVVDRDSIEPRFFIPTRIDQKGNIGDVISPETLAILKQPGWQNIGANGETTGIDLYFPNIGATPGNSQSNESSFSRNEDIDTTYSLGYYRIRQIVKTNAQKAVLGRTIRGIGLFVDDENSLLYPALGAAAEILPDIEPSLEGLPQKANTNINKNLFNAANNIRVPNSSFVIYQAGLGTAEHTQKITNNPQTSTNASKRIPSAKFNSIWLGMSPVTKRSFSQSYRYVPTGDERKITRAGGEGGINSDTSFLVATNENSIASTDLNNFYIQAYISFLERNVNFVTSNTLTEKTNYYPHLSFTGNITSNNSVFRYYTGVVAAQNLKLYLGGDYTRYWDNWLFNFSAIVYSNGDKDYFSKTEGSFSRKFKLSSTTNFSLFTEFRYGWEHNKINFLDNPADNFVSVGTSVDFKSFSLRVGQLLDLLPDSSGNKLQASFTTHLGRNASLTAYLSPQKNINNYGISTQYIWRNSSTTSSLVFTWNRNIYDFGNDNFGKDLETSNDTFSLMFKATFK